MCILAADKVCVTLEIFLNLLYHLIKIIVENVRWNRITFGDITGLSKTTFNLYKTVLCVLTLVAALLLVGCGGATSTRAKADETVHTALFDFTCGQAEVIDSYSGIDIPEGDKLVQFHISVANTSDSGFLIFKDDFQLQWGDGDSDFGVGFDAVDDDMLSEVTGVSPGSTLEGNILVAVPQDTTTLTVAYQETYEDGSDADAYFVDISL